LCAIVAAVPRHRIGSLGPKMEVTEVVVMPLPVPMPLLSRDRLRVASA
jgi:hypothetical protein